jgi:twitching motility protein PilT
MRDLETIHLALTAAETGHLVLSTVHTSSAAQTVDRIIDAFPHDQQQQIRIMLSNSLVAIISQTLIPRQEEMAGGSPITKGRVLAAEVLVNTAAVANLVREAKNSQLYATMQMGSKQGMQTLEQALSNLAKAGVITVDEAFSKTTRADDLKVLLTPERAAAQPTSQEPPPERRSMFGRLQ